jgi:hypothetical protein
MPKTQVSCPNCQQPVIAEIQQLFDVDADQRAKQMLLSGMYNMIQCSNCGYQGNLATPIVYHDPDKELLLTFVPPEIDLPRNEQEKVIGSLINQSINRLPQEKRKAYIFQPQSTLSMQGLVERILESDGITKEMIAAQEKRLQFIQRLLTASDESRIELAKTEEELIDAEFYGLLNRLYETAALSGDQDGAQKIADLQKTIMPVTEYGKELLAQNEEAEAAIKSLQDAGDTLTRDKLLDLLINAPGDTHLQVLVSLARSGMDYEFFQLLSQRIDRARGDGRVRLINLREQLLEMTEAIDRQAEERRMLAKQLLSTIVNSPNVEEALRENLPVVDEFFIREVESATVEARKSGNLEQLAALQKIAEVIEKASAPPPEVQFIEQLIQAGDDSRRDQILHENSEKITPEFLGIFANLLAQIENNEDKELKKQVSDVYDQVLRFSMQANLQS